MRLNAARSSTIKYRMRRPHRINANKVSGGQKDIAFKIFALH
jgi:hypothetical protein